MVSLKLHSFSLFPVFDYAYRDYILSWYLPLSRDEGQLYSMLSEDWWQMIGQLRSRLADIDLVNVVCYDSIRILHTHFTDLKSASLRYRSTHADIRCCIPQYSSHTNQPSVCVFAAVWAQRCDSQEICSTFNLLLKKWCYPPVSIPNTMFSWEQMGGNYFSSVKRKWH